MIEQLKTKLVNLTKQQQDIEALRKAASKDYREQLKEIRDEIKETVESIDDQS